MRRGIKESHTDTEKEGEFSEKKGEIFTKRNSSLAYTFSLAGFEKSA